jgi:Asp/Glu/hydantoin racemase
MTGRVVVINPNSSESVTRAIDRAVEPLRGASGPEIVCLTLAEGPPGIETQRHVDQVAAPLCRLIELQDNRAAAFVVACFSDPGLHAARETTAKPVFGIGESGLLTALTLGGSVGIISILAGSVPRHWRYVRALGIESRIAADVPIGLGVTELAQDEEVERRMVEVGRELIDRHSADVIVMGCAGMARQRVPLEASLGVPVVDPTQAAVGAAITAVRLGYRQNVRSRPDGR